MKQHPRNLRMAAILLLAVIVLATFSTSASAQITLFGKYYAVPNPGRFSDCSKADPCGLQAAVDIAADGDTIYLKGGSQFYHSTSPEVVYINKSVIIQGGWDGSPLGRFDFVDPKAYPTVLDGEDARRVILIDGNASPEMHGLVIQNGYVEKSEGGGVAIWNSSGGSVLINECSIVDNFAGWYGGGISIYKGTVTIQNSTLAHNGTPNGGGAMIGGSGSTVVLENNIISSNIAAYGSAGHFDRASLTARSNVARNNNGTPAFFVSNESGLSVIFENNLISWTNGAAVTITSNGADSFSFLHNTLVNNQGMGLHLSDNCSGLIANNIFAGNTNDSIYLGAGSAATLTHNLFWQNGYDPNKGSNAIEEDPLLTYTFNLSPGSPAIDAGTPVGVANDMDGHPRSASLPDIGADEFMLSLFLPATMR